MKYNFIIIIIFSLFWNNSTFAQDSLKIKKIDNQLIELNKTIDQLKERQQYQNGQINSQTVMIDTAFDGVSAEIGASSNFIGIFGILIAVFSIGLSIYVSRIAKNINSMKSDNEILLQKNIQIKNDLESLSDKITKDSDGLYKLIRDEESKHLIQRLISVPEDVCNLFGILASRELEKEHYEPIREGFNQIKDIDEDDEYKHMYLSLFFQHFSDLALLDDEIKPIMLDDLDNIFSMAFKNDTIKSISDFFNQLNQGSLNDFVTEINTYILSLTKSKYADDDEVYYAINNSVSSRDSKFQLYDLVSKAPDYNVFRENFGKIIIEYGYNDLEPKELAIINEINNI
jgi:hypothetical protein